MSDNVPRMRQRLADEALLWAVNGRDLESRLSRLMVSSYYSLSLLICGAELPVFPTLSPKPKVLTFELGSPALIRSPLLDTFPRSLPIFELS